MNTQEAIHIIRRELTKDGKCLNAELSRALHFLECGPNQQPLYYLEPGRAYILQLSDYGAVNQIDAVLQQFRDLGFDVVVIGPDMKILSTRPVTSNPCDGCATRWDCSGVCEKLAEALNHSDSVIVEDNEVELG